MTSTIVLSSVSHVLKVLVIFTVFEPHRFCSFVDEKISLEVYSLFVEFLCCGG